MLNRLRIIRVSCRTRTALAGFLAAVSLAACEPAETPRQMANKAEAACNRVYADNAQLASDCKLREAMRIYAAIYGRRQAEADSSINP
jgi:hypothetical protein